MAKPSVIPATLEHAEAMAPNLRECDRQEIWAASRQLPRDSLRHAVMASSCAWTGMVDDDIACMFGVVPQSLMSGSGFVWMLGTPLVEKHAVMFLRRNRAKVAEMASQFPYLHNYVDARNETAIRWLRWLGFTIHDAEPYGALGLPFHHFEMRHHV